MDKESKGQFAKGFGRKPNNYHCYLENKLERYAENSRTACENLRKELEDKIREKSIENKQDINYIKTENKEFLPIQWFVWTITASVAIITAWWCVSYSRLLDWQNETIKNIHELDKKVEINKANLDNVKSRDLSITVNEEGFIKLKE